MWGGKELFFLLLLTISVLSRVFATRQWFTQRMCMRISTALSTAKQSTGVSICSERRGKTALGKAFFFPRNIVRRGGGIIP